MYHNVEKSAFRRGEYVGHATGAWCIIRNGKGWRAVAGTIPGNCGRTIYGATLRDISEELERINEEIAQQLRAMSLPNPFAA